MPESFTDFCLEWGNKDRGLRWAVGRICQSYRDNPDNFPQSIVSQKDNEQDKYDYLVAKINMHIKEHPRLSAGNDEAGERLFVHTIRNWTTKDDINRNTPPTLKNELVALKILFYFKHFHKNRKEDKPNDQYFLQFLEHEIKPVGHVAKMRAQCIEKERRKKTPLIDNSANEEKPNGSKDSPEQHEINEDVYHNYPNEAVNEQYDEALNEEMEELFFSRQNWTGGDIGFDPEGIISAVVLNGPFGLRMTDKDRERTRRLFGTSTVRQQLRLLRIGYSGRLMSDLFRMSDPANDEISHELAKFDEPSEEFMYQALACIGSISRLRNLESLVTDQLTFAIFKCLTYHSKGKYLELCAFIFEHISRIERFTDFTRGMAAYLKSKYDTERGSASEVTRICKDAHELLLSHFRDHNVHAPDQNLISEIVTQKTSNIFTTSTRNNIGPERFALINAELAVAKNRAGLNDRHYEYPDLLAERIRKNADKAIGLYIPSVIHYSTEILKCIHSGYDATEFFECHKLLNLAIAESNPRTACVVLTPMISLAMHAGLPKIAEELYEWRHDGHLVDPVNDERKTIDSLKTFGVEPAIDLLTTYFMMKSLAKHGSKSAEKRLEVTKKKLLRLEQKYNTVSLKTVARYYARFKADVTGDKKAYIVSESHDAESHQLYFCVVDDEYVQK